MEINWEAIDAALRSKEVDPSCPACERNAGRWDAGNAVVRLPVFATKPANGKGLDPDKEPSVYVVYLSCPQCGHVRMFDIAGLLEDADLDA